MKKRFGIGFKRVVLGMSQSNLDRVPRLYRAASKIAKSVKEDGESLKNIVFSEKYKHYNVKALYALVADTLSRGAILDKLIEGTHILEKEKLFNYNPWLLRVLLTELLWKKQKLPLCGNSVKTVLKYHSEFLSELEKTNEVGVSEPSNGSVKGSKLRWVRVNTLITTVKDVILHLSSEGWELVCLTKEAVYKDFLQAASSLSENQFIRDYHIEELLAFPSKTNLTSHELYESGAIILQDKASLIPVVLLDPQPSSIVLDMCAGPGMKTTHIAARMQNKGTVFAVERNVNRFYALSQMLDNHNVSCVTPILEDAMHLNSTMCPSAEYILVDPSCSGTGIVDRVRIYGDEDKCDPKRLEKLSQFQFHLLKNALTMFPDVKRVVYCTCSLHSKENEQVVDDVLKYLANQSSEGPKFSLCNLSINSDWFHFSSSNFTCGQSCLYAKPDVDLTNGFFIAMFVRDVTESDKVPCSKIKNDKRKPTSVDLKTNIKNKRKKRKSNS